MVRSNAQILQYRIGIPGAEPRVHFRDESGKLRSIPFAQAAEHDYLPYDTGFLLLDASQYGIYAFLLGIPYETAGIYKEIVYRSIRFIFVDY